jgi:hypothetical protein
VANSRLFDPSLFMDLPAFIDIEASALGPGSYPIEVGFILGDGSLFCTLIKPAADWNIWDPAAEQTHGVPREALYMFGRSVAEVADALNHRLRGQTVYSDAWSNDCTWMALLFECAGLRQRFQLESLRSLLSEEQAGLWYPVKERVVAELGLRRHRASSDARILQMTYARTREIASLTMEARSIPPARLC